MSPSAEAAARESRRAAAHRRRRIIFNDDGGGLAHPKSDTPEGFLDVRLRPRLGTQMDSIFYCTGASTFTHDTRIAGVQLDDAPQGGGEPGRENARSLISAGRDVLQVVVDFAHEHDLEAFWTFRMNDIHDARDRHNLPKLKLDHPDWLIGGEDLTAHQDQTSREYWAATALDYAVDGVRENRSGLIEEVCERYDVDGIEMDFGRMPHLFPPGQEEQNLGVMTEFVRGVRQRMDQRAQERGRPLLLAARVPDTVELCRNIGLDIETYLSEGLLDMLTPGFAYDPWQMLCRELIELGHQHDVPVYPCLSNSPSYNLRVKWPHEWGAMDRGVASNYWHAGADGIYDFNDYIWGDFGMREWQVPIEGRYDLDMRMQESKWHEIGDPRTLTGKSKLYLVSGGIPIHYNMNEAGPSPLLPVDLSTARTLPLMVGDDVPSAVAQETLLGTRLRVHLQRVTRRHRLRFSMNGVPLRNGANADVHYDSWGPLQAGRGITQPPNAQDSDVFTPVPDIAGDCWVEYALGAPPLEQGANQLTVSVEEGSSNEAACIRHVELAVWYRG